ncbi:MAG: hypothetical protein IJ821_03320 [Lachnospiraceae bacterium]|nr:hypothetical protein [Lachnospiraceae bacterium]
MNRLQMAVQLVLISLVLSLTACGGADKALAERAGYYKATNVVQNGEELDLKNFFDMGLGFFLVLNEDGSGYLDMMEEKTPLTWDKSNITAGDGEDKDEQAYSYDNGTISMETEGTSMTFVRMTDTETEDYKNGKFGKSPEEIGEELAQGVLSGDEESIEKAKSMLGEENLADYTEDASAQTDDGYTLPDMSDESHEDAGYYSIYAYTENGTRYTAEELAAAGVTFDLMLCPDGTGYANFLDENYDLSWKDGYLNILKEDGVEIMDYGSGNYMGTKTISLTEEDDETDVTMSFEYASEADSTYAGKSGGGRDTASSGDSGDKEIIAVWKGDYTKFVGDPDEEDSKNRDPFTLELYSDGSGMQHRNNSDFGVLWEKKGDKIDLKEEFFATYTDYTGYIKGNELHLFNGDPDYIWSCEYVYTLESGSME